MSSATFTASLLSAEMLSCRDMIRSLISLMSVMSLATSMAATTRSSTMMGMVVLTVVTCLP